MVPKRAPRSTKKPKTAVPRNPRVSAIFSNAMDSLRMGVRHYLDEDLETRDKWAILALFHCIELLLKERLQRAHPLLIYSKIDAPVGADAHTVNVAYALVRLQNLGIELSEGEAKTLRSLQGRRNEIEHHRFEPSDAHRVALGDALTFIHTFLRDHLGDQLEDHVDVEMFGAIKKLLLDYEELVSRARRKVDWIRARLDPKEQHLLEVGLCPECDQETVTRDEDGRPYCHLCESLVDAGTCDLCGTFGPVDAELGICQNCFSYRVGRED